MAPCWMPTRPKFTSLIKQAEKGNTKKKEIEACAALTSTTVGTEG